MTGAGERKEGLATVLGELTPGARPAAGEAGQLDLLSADDAPEEVGGGPLDAALADLGASLRSTPRRGRGGRPAGAGNRSTEAWRKYFFSQRRDPAFALADVYSMPVEELAARLCCDKLSALKVQTAAAAALLPYLHQRLPQAVDIRTDALPTLVLYTGAPASEHGSAGAVGGGGVLDLTVTDVVEFQELSASGAGNSDKENSDSDRQAVDDAGETSVNPTDLGSVP